MSDTTQWQVLIPTSLRSHALRGKPLADLHFFPMKNVIPLLLAIADALELDGERILAANARDCETAETLVSRGKMSHALFSRLRIKERGIAEMSARVREVANLSDPLGKRLASRNSTKI